MKNTKDKVQIPEDTNLSELLDKLIRLQEGNRPTPFYKKVIYIVVSICCIMFVGLICISIYKNNFTTESILATLLAFFSIFISIFFYFKADETSTKFYDSSYKFMKDVSVTLGKIEERFGEKLNSINDKMSHFEKISQETSAEIEDKQEDKDRIINELIEKADLSEEERKSFIEEIKQKEQEIELLKEHKFRVEREAARLRKEINESTNSYEKFSLLYDRDFLNALLNNEEIVNNLSIADLQALKRRGYINSEGKLNKDRIFRDMRSSKIHNVI